MDDVDQGDLLTMQRERVIWLTATFMVVFLPAVLLQARVYETRATGDVFQPASFGRQLYAAIMRINGGRAEVSVVDCEGGWAALRAAFQSLPADVKSRFQVGHSLALGSATADHRTVRLVALTPESTSRTLLVTVAQRQDEREASAAPPLRHELEGIPAAPESTLLSFQRNQETRTAMERMASRQSRLDLQAYYEAEMPRAGWSRLMGASTAGGLAVYVKGAEICCIRIGEKDSNGESVVTLLHKPGAVN